MGYRFSQSVAKSPAGTLGCFVTASIGYSLSAGCAYCAMHRLTGGQPDSPGGGKYLSTIAREKNSDDSREGGKMKERKKKEEKRNRHGKQCSRRSTPLLQTTNVSCTPKTPVAHTSAHWCGSCCPRPKSCRTDKQDGGTGSWIAQGRRVYHRLSPKIKSSRTSKCCDATSVTTCDHPPAPY